MTPASMSSVVEILRSRLTEALARSPEPQARIADYAGMAEATLSRWKKQGFPINCKLETLVALAEALDVPPHRLLDPMSDRYTQAEDPPATMATEDRGVAYDATSPFESLERGLIGLRAYVDALEAEARGLGGTTALKRARARAAEIVARDRSVEAASAVETNA